MKLINGRGQLGQELSKYINYNIDVTIYHTWDITDKSEERQEQCLIDFINYVDTHKKEKIVFISTLHENYCEYLMSKMEAELYILKITDNGVVIRLPYILGKGLCDRIKEGGIVYDGLIEVESANVLAKKIIDTLEKKDRIHFIHGQWMSAKLVESILQYGMKK